MNEIEFKLVLNEKLCDLADAILHYYNPCLIRGNSCLLTDDIQNDPLHCCHKGIFDKSPDDSHCQFRAEGRCSFRYIKCKLFLCETALRASLECAEDMRIIESLAKRYGLTRRPFLGDRYVGRTEELNRTK